MIVVDDKKKDVDNDYTYSREVLYDLIEKGRESASEDMIEVARESPNTHGHLRYLAGYD